jgi:two-component sensor histidine kinase
MLKALLTLAAKKTASAEAQRVLIEAGNRIAAMAAAQQVLYGTADATRFKAHDFLNAVCGTARQTFSRDVAIFARPKTSSSRPTSPCRLL